jgi:hypothetical protein
MCRITFEFEGERDFFKKHSAKFKYDYTTKKKGMDPTCFKELKAMA